MRFFRPLIVTMALGLILHTPVLCKNQETTVDRVLNFPSSFLLKINKKTSTLEARLTKQTERYLQRLSKREKKLQRKLSKINSNAAKQLFANGEEQHRQLTDKIKGKTEKVNNALRGEYLPGMESLKTSLSFLQQNSQLLGDAKQVQQKVQGSLAGVNQLQSKLGQAEQVKVFIRLMHNNT